MVIRGRSWKYGSNVDTDRILPAKYVHLTDPGELGKHCLEHLDPEFSSKVSKGDILVAESNFGCGSSREVAPLAIRSAGISCVIAKSFARIFFRNSINIGLPILECSAAVDGISPGDNVEVDLRAGKITNLTTGKSFAALAFPPFLQRIIDLGGLMNTVRARLKERDN